MWFKQMMGAFLCGLGDIGVDPTERNSGSI